MYFSIAEEKLIDKMILKCSNEVEGFDKYSYEQQREIVLWCCGILYLSVLFIKELNSFDKKRSGDK